MSGKAQRPPAGEPWVWLTRDLITSPAWTSMSINARRFIDVLLAEHLRQGGRKNGELQAPWRQLEEAHVGARYVSVAIDETVHLSLVDCWRGIGRQPNRYALTWSPECPSPMKSNRRHGCGSPKSRCSIA